jgi:hypothetical protein
MANPAEMPQLKPQAPDDESQALLKARNQLQINLMKQFGLIKGKMKLEDENTAFEQWYETGLAVKFNKIIDQDPSLLKKYQQRPKLIQKHVANLLNLKKE